MTVNEEELVVKPVLSKLAHEKFMQLLYSQRNCNHQQMNANKAGSVTLFSLLKLVSRLNKWLLEPLVREPFNIIYHCLASCETIFESRPRQNSRCDERGLFERHRVALTIDFANIDDRRYSYATQGNENSASATLLDTNDSSISYTTERCEHNEKHEPTDESSNEYSSERESLNEVCCIEKQLNKDQLECSEDENTSSEILTIHHAEINLSIYGFLNVTLMIKKSLQKTECVDVRKLFFYLHDVISLSSWCVRTDTYFECYSGIVRKYNKLYTIGDGIPDERLSHRLRYHICIPSCNFPSRQLEVIAQMVLLFERTATRHLISRHLISRHLISRDLISSHLISRHLISRVTDVSRTQWQCGEFRKHILGSLLIPRRGGNKNMFLEKNTKTDQDFKESLLDSASGKTAIKALAADELTPEDLTVEMMRRKCASCDDSRRKVSSVKNKTIFSKRECDKENYFGFIFPKHDFKMKPKQSRKQSSDTHHEDLFLSLHKSTCHLLPCPSARNITVNTLVNGLDWALFEREAFRVASFSNYPSSAVKSAILLASSGFVYVGGGTNDKVRCFFCLAEKEEWQANDDIYEVHTSLNPACLIVTLQSSNYRPIVSSILPDSAASSATLVQVNNDDEQQHSSSIPVSDTSTIDNIPVSETSTIDNIPVSDTSTVDNIPVSDTSTVDNIPVSDTSTVDNIPVTGDADTSPYSTGNMVPARDENAFHSTGNQEDVDMSRALSDSSLSRNMGFDSNVTESRTTPSALLLEQNRTSVINRTFVETTAPHQLTSNIAGNDTRNASTSQTLGVLRNGNPRLTSTRDHQHSLSSDPNSKSRHLIINSQIYSVPASSGSSTIHGDTNTTASDDQPTHSDISHQTHELTYETLGILHGRPLYTDMAILAKRILSFEFWPEIRTISVEDLAKAGLYYVGYNDVCNCFYCGGGLRNWNTEDNPFVEHARWFKDCSYIRQCMGQEFMAAVLEVKPKNGIVTYNDVAEHMNKKGQTIRNMFDDSPITNDAAVNALIHEGYNEEKVSNVALHLKKQGKTLSSDVIAKKLKEEESGLTSESDKESDESKSDDENIHELKEQIYSLRGNLVCKICMDKEVRMVFLPCGHLTSCQECAMSLQDCPVCRSHIRGSVKANIC